MARPRRVRVDFTFAEAQAYDLAAGNSYTDPDWCKGYAAGAKGAALSRAINKMRAAMHAAAQGRWVSLP